MNRVLAEHGVNVEGQLLRTRDEFGYVPTDIGCQYTQDVLAELTAMPVTIRLRTLRSRDLNNSPSRPLIRPRRRAVTPVRAYGMYGV